MARVLIVGCGCHGRALAGELAGAGHAVRGTTRDPARVAGIEAAGAEGAVADPDRLGTVMAQLAGVSVVCWLMGSVDARSATALHGPRLQTLLQRLVDIKGDVDHPIDLAFAVVNAKGPRFAIDAGPH